MTEEFKRRLERLVWEEDIGALAGIIEEQAGQIDHLRAALKKYGLHGIDKDGYDCPRNMTFSAGAECTCGLVEAIID